MPGIANTEANKKWNNAATSRGLSIRRTLKEAYSCTMRTWQWHESCRFTCSTSRAWAKCRDYGSQKGWWVNALSQFDRNGLLTRARLENILNPEGRKVMSRMDLSSRLLSRLCNLLCGLQYASLSQVAICHAASESNWEAKRNRVDGDVCVV